MSVWKPHEFYKDKQLKQEPIDEDDYWMNQIFVEYLCPVCEVHLTKFGTCINFCHLGPEGSKAALLKSSEPIYVRDRRHKHEFIN